MIHGGAQVHDQELSLMQVSPVLGAFKGLESKSQFEAARLPQTQIVAIREADVREKIHGVRDGSYNDRHA